MQSSWQSPSQASSDNFVSESHKVGILIADDNEMVRNVLSLGLRRRGFDVWLASHGLEAVETYARLRDEIAVVLLDVRMPELDGPQAMICLHRLDPRLPVCFLTGDLGPYSEAELTRMGAVQIFRKPIKLDQFADQLHQVVAGAPADLCTI